MNPNFKKKKPLPYKNLGELYTEAVQGEPSINRLPIVETGSVLITRDNGAEDVLRQNVSDKDLNKITRIINSTDNEVPIKDLLEQSGFSSEGTIVTLTVAAFNEQNIDSIKLKEVIKKKESKDLDKFFEKYLDIEGVFNIKEHVLVPVLSAFTDTPRELIDNLFKITPPQKTIGVGPGEVCIALFTNFAKGRPGDLINGDKKIEVKANGGRVGKSGYSLAFPTHAKIVLKNGTSIVQSKYVITINDALQKIIDINYKNITGLNDYIESIKSSIDNAQIEPEKIKELIQQGEKIYELRYELRLPHVINYQLDRIINALNSSMKSLSTGKPPAWSQTVQDFFFGDHSLDQEQIIDGLIELRSEDGKGSDSLRVALSGIITDENYENYFKGGDGRKKLDRLTLAIQTASYQCYEKFNYLLVINKSYKAVSLKFDSADDIGDSFIQMLKYIDKYSLTTGLANDPSRKAISIELP